jgi:hypothetical protein
MNGLLPELAELKKIFPGKFIITKEVKQEVIDKPLTIKRFELEAIKIQELLNKKIIELPTTIGINDSEISESTQQIMQLANKTFIDNTGKEIHIIDLGESSCLALGKILNKKSIKNVLAIDERTTRILCEKPENLKKILQKKLHRKIQMRRENLKFFKEFKIVRSTELIYFAYKKGIVRIKQKKILQALLNALKFKGASISFDEIEKIKKLA